MSNKLLNSSAELKANFGGLSLNFTWANISSFEEDVERDIIAETISQDALDYFTGNLDTLTGIPAQALQLLQRCAAYLTVEKWSNYALFQFEDKALYLAKTTNGAIPSDKKLEQLRKSCQETGFNFLDKAIDLMEANLTLFSAYADSATRLSNHQCFIKTAVEFHQIKRINRSRLTYNALVPIMQDIQDRKVANSMTRDYYNTYLEKYLDDDLTSDEKKLLPYIRKAVAFLAISDACTTLPVEIRSDGIFINHFNNSIEWGQKDAAAAARLDMLKDDYCDKGDRALRDMENYLKGNPTYFPGYVAPVSTDVCVNDKCNGLFMM